MEPLSPINVMRWALRANSTTPCMPAGVQAAPGQPARESVPGAPRVIKAQQAPSQQLPPQPPPAPSVIIVGGSQARPAVPDPPQQPPQQAPPERAGPKVVIARGGQTRPAAPMTEQIPAEVARADYSPPTIAAPPLPSLGDTNRAHREGAALVDAAERHTAPPPAPVAFEEVRCKPMLALNMACRIKNFILGPRLRQRQGTSRGRCSGGCNCERHGPTACPCEEVRCKLSPTEDTIEGLATASRRTGRALCWWILLRGTLPLRQRLWPVKRYAAISP